MASSEAIEKYTQAINNCPESSHTERSTYHQNKAAALEKQENWQGVIDECAKAIELNHRYTKAFLRRSKAYEKIGNKELCLEDITTVCLLENFSSTPNMLFADQILKKLGFERASETYRARKHRLASALFIKQYFNGFQEDITTDPLTDKDRSCSKDSGYIRAKIAWEEGKLDQVIDECTAEIQEADAPPEAANVKDTEMESVKRDRLAKSLLVRATFFLLSCRNDEAQKDLNRVIDMEDANPKVRVNALIKRGSMMMQMQKSDEAEADHNLAAQIDPENADIFHHRGQYFIIMNKVAEALKDFNRCIEIKGDYALAHAQRCYTKYRQAFATGDIVQAEMATAEFQEIITKYPCCSETYGLYAQAESDRRNFESADNLFKKALEIEPDNASLYVHRGTLLLQWKQDVVEAINIIKIALEVDPECDFAHEMLATIEVQRQNLDQALYHFEQAINNSRTEAEMAHLHSLRAAAIAQTNIKLKYGITPPPLSQLPSAPL